MKAIKSTVILVSSLFIFLSSCNTEEHFVQEESQKQSTIFLLDMSDSMNEVVRKRMIQKLRPIAYDGLQNPKDETAIYFITNSSGSNELFGRYVLSEFKLPDHFAEFSEQRQKQELVKRENKIKSEQQYFLAMLKKAMETPVSKEAQKGTDLWSTLRIAAENFAKEDSNTIKKVVYVSDMLQNSKERGFYKTPPKDDTEAKEIGKKDAARILAKWPQIKEANSLEGVKVYCIQPRELLQGKHREKAPLMFAYWQAIFEELGASFTME